MMIAYKVPLPSDGLNTSDSPRELTPAEAASLANLQPVGRGLESLRGRALVPGTYLAQPTDSVLVYRKLAGNVYYAFIVGNNLYYKSALPNTPAHVGWPPFDVPTTPVRLLQVGDWAILSPGYFWTGGVSIYPLNVAAPTTAPTVSASGGGSRRDYYFTYYNPTFDLESNPSPVRSVTDMDSRSPIIVDLFFADLSAADRESFTQIRLYRTGVGITAPRLVRTETIPAGNTLEINPENSLDEDVAQNALLSFGHDKAPAFTRMIVHNNRLVVWGASTAPSTVYLSNLNEYAYFPVLPMLDKDPDEPQSGGPIEVRPGDGGTVQAAVSFGGELLIFKERICYRASESQVGFWNVQHFFPSGCQEPGSIAETPAGLVWLSQDGFMLLTHQERLVRIGGGVKSISDKIDHAWGVESAMSRGRYLVCYRQVGSSTDRMLVWSQETGWSGEHSAPGKVLFEDTDGVLYAGRTDAGGLSKALLNDTGVLTAETQTETVAITYATGALDFEAAGWYKRIRSVRISGRTLSGSPPTLTLSVLDEAGTVRTSSTFTFPLDGTAEVGVASAAQDEYLQLKITGALTAPIRIGSILVNVEKGATVNA